MPTPFQPQVPKPRRCASAPPRLIEPEDYKQIKKTELQEFIIKKLYDYKYYENIDFVKKVLDLYFFRIPKKQASNLYYQYVKFRDDDDEE